MSASSAPLPELSPSIRLSCAISAVGVAAAVVAAMLGMFHYSSAAIWLKPTPALMALTEACGQLPSRPVRMHCVQSVVEAQRGRTAQAPRLVAAGQGANAAMTR